MTTSLPFFILRKANRQRLGVSPVIATTIILAITITLGLGLWSFAASGVSTSTQNYADVVTEYGRYTSDRFVIVNMDFDNPTDGKISFWIYNSGKISTTITEVVLTCKDCGDLVPEAQNLEQYLPDDDTDPMSVASKDFAKFTFELTPGAIDGDSDFGDKTYELTVISDTGATQTFLKRSD